MIEGLLGNTDTAFECLELAYAERASLGAWMEEGLATPAQGSLPPPESQRYIEREYHPG